MAMNRICFIVNPRAGSRTRIRRILRLIEQALKPIGMDYSTVSITGPGEGVRAAAEAVSQGFTVIAAVGGDGTVNAVGQALMGSAAALAVIPAGSGNGFARNLGIPLRPSAALRLLRAPRIMRIDAGIINNRYFFNMAGLGLDAEISKRFAELTTRGTAHYFLAGLKTFFRYKPAAIRIHAESGTFNACPLVLSIANGAQYGSGAVIAPRAHPADGKLDVCLIDMLSAWKAIANLHRLFDGTINTMPGYRSFQTRALHIERATPGLIHVDGEPCEADAVFEVRVLPRKLLVVSGKSI